MTLPPPTTLGLTTYAYYWAGASKSRPFTPRDLLERAAALDLNVIQYCENLPIIGWSPDELTQFRRDAEAFGIRIEPGMRGLDPDALRAGIEAAALVGSPLLRVVPWSGSETQHRMTGDALFDALKPVLPLCHQLGVALAVENYFDIPDAELAACVKRFDDDLIGVCLDTANSTGFLQEPLATVALLAPYVLSLHLKDFAILKPVMGYRVVGVPLGRGWLDVKGVLDLVYAQGRSPNILLELWVDPSENDEATLTKEDAWVRESVSYVRHLVSAAAF